MRRFTKLWLFLLACVAASIGAAACQDTPQPLPVRTLERAQRMDLVCMRLYDENRRAIAPEPVAIERCASAAAYNPLADFSALPFHLFAVITQSLRGELAIADLTVGRIIDTDLSTPGVNHVPIGALPLDVAISPNGELAFATTGEVNKFGIYAIPTRTMLGDAFGKSKPPSLTDFPACALPEPAHAITAVPRAAANGDAGTGADGYDVLVVFRGDGTESKIVTIDGAAFERGAGIDSSAGTTINKATLEACPIRSAISLATAPPQTSVALGPTWYGGLPYVDGGAVDQVPIPPTPFCAGSSIEGSDAGAQTNGGAASDAGAAAIALPTRPFAGRTVRDGNWLYVADDGQSIIHVFDLSGATPFEIEPLVLSRAKEPGARVAVIDLAVSPSTRDFRRYLYAVDAKDGSILVFDVSDPRAGVRLPLTRPHPETNPAQPLDRISLGGPVATVTFARFDYPVADGRVAIRTGLLCTPSGNVDDDGFIYSSASSEILGPGLGPARLRGVFAFAVLASGQLVVIDVDDWDAPCRRPALVDGKTSATSPAQTAKRNDPYGVPESNAVTDEAFFPISAPHRIRSKWYLRSDVQSGNRIPRVESLISLELERASLPTTGNGAEKNPLIIATNDPYGIVNSPPGGDFAAGNVQMSFEAPDVHLNQDWAVVYEGVLPTIEADALVATMSTTTDDRTVELSSPGAAICVRGVEDHKIGAARGAQIVAEQQRLGYPIDRNLVNTITDYAVITDELLASTDPYWNDNRSCWTPELDSAGKRFDACLQTYGGAADNNPNRDFPILEAYDDQLVIGAFTPAREASSSDSNKGLMRLMRCCFHDQSRFRVRAGGQWVAIGTASGFSRHVVKSQAGECVLSCDRTDALLNARVPAISRPQIPYTVPSRDSAVAFRNAQMSFAIFNGDVGLPKRDMLFRFATRGEFEPITLSIAQSSVSVSPQSTRYIDGLAQIAVIDGQAQGLTLIDLQSLAISRTLF